MKLKTATNATVIIAVVAVVGLAILYIRDAAVTNRMVAQLSAHDPGAPFAEVVEANGEPDEIYEVQSSWRWGRRARNVPANVTHIAVYHRAIVPQVCAFLLDEDDIIVEVDTFSGY